MSNNNINFIFGLLNKKKVAICLLIDALLDVIYYVVPFTFTFLLTMPFTLKKAIIVAMVFIISKSLRCIGNYFLTKLLDNYLYEYEKIQYLEFYKKISRIPVETLSKYQTGYLENVIGKTSELVQRILKTEYVSIIAGFAFFFYTVFKQSIILFFISLILSFLCVYVCTAILKKGNKELEKLYDQEYEYSSKYQDYISNIRTIKALNNSEYFENKIKSEGNICYKKSKRYIKYYSIENLVRNTLIVIPFILAIIKAVIDLSHGIDTLGIIAFYISIQVEMGFIFDELSETILNWYELKVIKQKLKKIFKNLDERITINDFNLISLNNIVISYPETNFDIFVEKLEIKKNDKVSITGKSGQGKTSILNLILGNISHYKGSIILDDHDFSSTKLNIGVVSQEIELFNTSIKENLCLGKEIADNEIEKYLKELELDEILMFNNGINTIVGEKSLKLSTGQKRRINILRSYLMDRDIYILDEPTSNLDKHTEEIVVKFILKHFSKKTLIVSTHNEKINEICNKFYRFENHKLKDLNNKEEK